MKELSLIVPAYNEEKRIKQTIVEYLKRFDPAFADYEIIIVLNGCRDRTIDIVKGLSEENSKVRYLNYDQTIGKGGAILEGFKNAEGKIIGFLDADDAFNLTYIIRIVKLVERYDCVIASKWKYQKFAEINEPNLRKMCSRIWNLLARTLLNLNYYDTQAGAKFFRKETIDSIDLDFICKDFSFDVELLSKIKDRRHSIIEVYVPSKYIRGTTFRLKYSINMLLNLLKFWWKR